MTENASDSEFYLQRKQNTFSNNAQTVFITLGAGEILCYCVASLYLGMPQLLAEVFNYMILQFCSSFYKEV